MSEKKIKAFSLTELMIVLGVFSLVSVMIFLAFQNMGQSLDKPSKIVRSQKDLMNFSHGVYNFLNNSLSAYMMDGQDELDYRNEDIEESDPRCNILYLQKDEEDNTGRIVYNENEHQFEWYRLESTQNPEIMLEDVYRIDAVWDENGEVTEGEEIIFKFPHNSILYDANFLSRPKFVVIQFRKIIVPANSRNPSPMTIPMTLMIEVNTSHFEEEQN